MTGAGQSRHREERLRERGIAAVCAARYLHGTGVRGVRATMLGFAAIALMLLVSSPAKAPAPVAPLPPIGGIAPPPGTMLLTMDIAAGGRSRPVPDVYRIASALPVAEFRAAYAAAARHAGYETTVRPRSIVGWRPGAGSFRLVLASKDNATTGVLSVQNAGRAGLTG
jgi:hypothetical protein